MSVKINNFNKKTKIYFVISGNAWQCDINDSEGLTKSEY